MIWIPLTPDMAEHVEGMTHAGDGVWELPFTADSFAHLNPIAENMGFRVTVEQYEVHIPADSDGASVNHPWVEISDNNFNSPVFENDAYPFSTVQPGDSGSVLSEWSSEPIEWVPASGKRVTYTSYRATWINESPVDQFWRLRLELAVEGDGPGPEPVVCFWTDLVRAEQVCGAAPEPPAFDFVSSAAGGSGGAMLRAADWTGGGQNLIAETLTAWIGQLDGAGPTVRVATAKDAGGSVVYERANSSEACNFACAGPVNGGPDDEFHIFGRRPDWAPDNGAWTGAEVDTPYIAEVEFLDQSGGVIGVATGQLTFTPGY